MAIKSSTETPSADPIKVFRFGNVIASVFEKSLKTKEGKPFTKHNITLRRRYYDDGKVKFATVLGSDDLLAARVALQKCYEHITDRRRHVKDEESDK